MYRNVVGDLFFKFYEASSLFHLVIHYVVLYTERQKKKKKKKERFGLKHQSNERYSYIKMLLKIYLSYTNKTSSLFQRNRRKLIKE